MRPGIGEPNEATHRLVAYACCSRVKRNRSTNLSAEQSATISTTKSRSVGRSIRRDGRNAAKNENCQENGSPIFASDRMHETRSKIMSQVRMPFGERPFCKRRQERRAGGPRPVVRAPFLRSLARVDQTHRRTTPVTRWPLPVLHHLQPVRRHRQSLRRCRSVDLYRPMLFGVLMRARRFFAFTLLIRDVAAFAMLRAVLTTLSLLSLSRF